MIRTARAMDLFTMSYTFNAQEARAMAEADVDVLIAHLGLTVGGALGTRRAVVLSEAVPRVRQILRAAKAAKGELVCLPMGGRFPLRRIQNISTGTRMPWAFWEPKT